MAKSATQDGQTHHLVMGRGNGLQFPDCPNPDCDENLGPLEYHFDVVDGDEVECPECGEKVEVFGV